MMAQLNHHIPGQGAKLGRVVDGDGGHMSFECYGARHCRYSCLSGGDLLDYSDEWNLLASSCCCHECGGGEDCRMSLSLSLGVRIQDLGNAPRCIAKIVYYWHRGDRPNKEGRSRLGRLCTYTSFTGEAHHPATPISIPYVPEPKASSKAGRNINSVHCTRGESS